MGGLNHTVNLLVFTFKVIHYHYIDQIKYQTHAYYFLHPMQPGSPEAPESHVLFPAGTRCSDPS